MLIEAMQSPPATRPAMARAALALTSAAACSVLFSIAISQILMALALAALLLSGEQFRFPPVKAPLALFCAATLAALWLSPDPYAGTPQVRKFFVFAILLLIPATFRTVEQVRNLVFGWTAIALLSTARGFGQFLERRAEAQAQNASTYGFYLDARITGLASHWMTFGGEIMIVLLMLAAWLLFSAKGKWKAAGWLSILPLYAALALGLTRSIFLLAVPVGFAFLLYAWKPWTVGALLALLGAGLLAAPFHVRERVTSVVRPHHDLDSNAPRTVMRRTGWEMVKAHPWFGIGPEQVKVQFERYVPPDIPRPLPRGWYGHLHNQYLQYAAERGIPALLFLLWFIAKVLWDFAGGLRRMPPGDSRRFALYGGMAAVLAILAEGMFECNLGDSEVLTVFLTAVACGYAAMGTSCA